MFDLIDTNCVIANLTDTSKSSMLLNEKKHVSSSRKLFSEFA